MLYNKQDTKQFPQQKKKGDSECEDGKEKSKYMEVTMKN